MLSLFKFLFYFFIALFILGLIARYTLQFWVKRFFNKMNPSESNEPHNNFNSKKKNNKKKLIDKGEGEYIDYEEVK